MASSLFLHVVEKALVDCSDEPLRSRVFKDLSNCALGALDGAMIDVMAGS